jgi:5-methylcytosine-specific restriction endonuclease McrA
MSGGTMFWTDDLGRVWKVPEIKGRLKMKIPCHRALKEYVIRRDKVCRICGKDKDLIADHIVSRRNGGAHHPDNMQALCRLCNAAKVGLIDKKGVHR